jgi:hypothetical protein
VGRVGALAVALGVGAAVATGFGMGVARADDGASVDMNSSAADSTSGAPADISPDPVSPPTGQAGQSTQSGGSDGTDPDAGEGDGPVDTGMDVASSGGLDTSVNDVGQSTDDAGGIEEEDGDDEDARAPKPTARAGGHDSRAAAKTAVATKPWTSVSVATSKPESPVGQKVSMTEGTVSGMGRRVSSVTTITASQLVSTVVAPEPVNVSASVPVVRAFVSTLLSPLSAPGPTVPVDATVALGLLAWVRNEEQRRYTSKAVQGPSDTKWSRGQH